LNSFVQPGMLLICIPLTFDPRRGRDIRYYDSPFYQILSYEELDSPAVNVFRRAIAEVKQRWSVIGWVIKNLLSRAGLHLQSLAPTNPHWACVVGYGPFSLCVIYKEGLCSSSGGINGLTMKLWGYPTDGIPLAFYDSHERKRQLFDVPRNILSKIILNSLNLTVFTRSS
jgi:hypothetical protein